jgi:hypothetical protein
LKIGVIGALKVFLTTEEKPGYHGGPRSILLSEPPWYLGFSSVVKKSKSVLKNKSPIEMGDNLTLKTTNMKILTILPIITSPLKDLFNKVVKGFIS